MVFCVTGDHNTRSFLKFVQSVRASRHFPSEINGVNNILWKIELTRGFSAKVILENLSRGDDYECPFARTSIALTKMLCEVLEINGEPRK